MVKSLKLKITDISQRDSCELPFDSVSAAADYICGQHSSLSRDELTDDLIKGFPIHAGNYLYRREASNQRDCDAFSNDIEQLATLDPQRLEQIREAYEQASESLRVLLRETHIADATVLNSSGEFLEEHLCILGALESLNTGTLGLILQDWDRPSRDL